MKRYLLLSCTFFLLISTTVAQQWETLAPVPGPGRDDAVAFAVNGYGYVVTGNQGGFAESNRLWRLDPASGTWTEKTAFPGEARQYAGAFVIGEAAYIVGGISAGSVPLADVWRYHPATDAWTQLPDFPGEARWSMFAGAMLGRGYIGTGATPTHLLSDCWRYDPATGQWTQLAVFPGGVRRETVAFTIAGSIYAGLGYAALNGTDFRDDFYAFNAFTDTWESIAAFPGNGRSYAVATGTDSYGYIGTGQDAGGAFYNDCLRYDPLADQWEQQPSLPVAGIRGMSAFSIGETPYFLTGLDATFNRVPGVWRCNDLQPAPGITFYPNPSEGTLIVKAPAASNVRVLTLDGKQVLESSIPETRWLLLTQLPAGVFLLEIVTDGERFAELLLVN